MDSRWAVTSARATVLAALLLVAAACSSSETTSPDAEPFQEQSTTSTAVETTTATPEAASTTSAVEERAPDPAESFVPDEVDWSECSGLECASVAVPLDYSDPATGTIDLAVIRSVAPASENAIGSLFINFGGPGFASKSSLRSFVPIFRQTPFGDSFDLVAWDTRGVGESSPIPCDSDAIDSATDDVGLVDPSDGFDDELAAETEAFERLVECAGSAQDLLDNIGTIDVARDLDVLRRAVGDPGLNYLGYSYGTEIGWVYATMFPDNVRAMVLDGVVDPVSQGAGFVDQYAGFERTFEYFDEVCAREPACSLREAGLAQTVDRLTAELAADPIELPDGTAFDGEQFLAATISTLYLTPDQIGPNLVRWIRNTDSGDPSAFVDFVEFNRAGLTPGAYEAVLCADGFRPRSDAEALDLMEELLEAAPRFGQLNEVLLCGNWPATAKPLPELDTTGAPPILVIGNTLDPATPYEAAVRLSEDLAEGSLLTYVGAGHTIVGFDACIDASVAEYLVDGVLPPEGTECGGPGIIGVQLTLDDGALTVARVTTEGPADDAGVEAGDVLVSIDDRRIADIVDLPAFVPGEPVTIEVERNGEAVILEVDPEYRPWH